MRLAVAFLFLCVCLTSHAAGLRVTQLSCDSRMNPLGVDTARPRLGWVLESSQRGQAQTAYQIQAASSPALLDDNKPDLWDSTKIVSNQSLQVPYAGDPLHSGQRVYWKVRVWDKQGKESDYSSPAWWETALLTPADWRAVWITRPRPTPLTDAQRFEDDPAPLFRSEFAVLKKVRRARFYISGLGYYELHLNGQRVGDSVLDPGWTSYAQRVLYSTYDVTELVKRGPNAIGIMLGNGWFNPLPLKHWNHLKLRDHLTIGEPRVIAQLVLEFTDGTSQTVVTDPTWKATSSPVIRNNVYLGEVYDARRELPGWDLAGFNDSAWEDVSQATEPLGPLHAQEAPPIRITRTLKPVKLTEPEPGVWIFDMGQNFAGWVRLHVKGPAGTRVSLRYGELLYPDGDLNGMTSVAGQIKGGGPNYCYPGTNAPKTAFQLDQYVLSGKGDEVFTPHFTFHGFRYVEVTGFPGQPTLESLEGLRLNSDVASAGSFTCSNERLNRIQQMVLWTELSNLFSVESDCPHREKFGYGGDMVVASEMAMLNFDMSRFYAKAVRDLVDAARPNGGFTETAPFVGIADSGLGQGAGPVEWGTAEPFLQWQLYRYYGDRRLLEENYAATQRWLALLRTCATNDILDNGLSDHETIAPKARALTGTGFYYLNAKLAAQIAHTLGHENDAKQAEVLAAQISAAFNRKFLHWGTGRYDTATQACQAFALYLGLVPAEEQEQALQVLVHDIVDAHQGHLTTGIFGTKFMLDALTEQGRADVAYQMVNQSTYPGWGYMLERGATTVWEHWEYSDNTYSHNHPMFGSVSEWFYKALAGIQPAPESAGCDRLVLAPQPVGDLTWVKASYDSVRGNVVSEWQKKGRRFQWRVHVPVGATATAAVPAPASAQVTESGDALDRAPGVRVLRRESDKALLALVSGDYRFTVITK